MPKATKQKLEAIFDLVKEKSYVLRKASPESFDGKGFWQPIKTMLEPLDHVVASKWRPISKTKTRQIMLLPEYTINGYEQKHIDEHNHFIIQQVRIPLIEVPSIKKIIQIALNIGQYKGVSQGLKKYPHDVKFENLDEFIMKKDIVKLSKYISDDLVAKIKELL